MKSKLVGASLGLLALVASGCGSGPRLEVPTPPASHYTAMNPIGIHTVSASEVCVVGNLTTVDGTPEGLILASETSGSTWHRRAVEVHDLRRVSFHTVYFGDRLRGWVAGIRVDEAGLTRPTVFRTEDGGNHWREVLLPQGNDVVVTEVHNLAFSSDRDGVVGVTLNELSTGLEKQTYFTTQDAGRSWTAQNFHEEPKAPAFDHTSSFIDAKRGYRLVKTAIPGVSMVEITGSGGKDWMPVSELTLSSLSTYY